MVRVDNYGEFHKYWLALYWSADLKKWPFDTQLLGPTLRHPNKTAEHLILSPWVEQSGHEPLDSPGWLQGDGVAQYTSLSRRVHPQSQLTTVVSLARPKLKAVLKVFVPPLLILLVVMTSFLLSPKDGETKVK